MSNAICVQDMGKSFRNVRVLDGLSFEVPLGSIFGLIGPNGAGKTTTMKILMNFLQAGEGKAEVLGTDTRRIGPQELTHIGYVAENQELPDWMTAGYYLSYLKPFYPSWDDARLAALLKMFDLPLNRKLANLSRGMRMKAALASCLAYHPKLLVLDEPFSGLDPVMRDDFIQGILESAEETTILISSHDLAEIETFASHIGYLANGRLQFSEEMTSLTQRFRQVEVALGMPIDAVDKAQWPATWLLPEWKGSQLRFIDSDFDAEETPRRVKSMFGEMQQLSITPLPLRSIFLALARHKSKAA